MSFRIKLLLAMMLVVGAVTTATLLATQKKVQAAYQEIFEGLFQNEITYFTQLQDARLTPIRAESLEAVKSVRIVAALNELRAEPTPDRIKDLYQIFENVFFAPGSAARRSLGGPRPFFRFLDENGK